LYDSSKLKSCVRWLSSYPTATISIDHNLIDGYRDHGDEGETRSTDYVA